MEEIKIKTKHAKYFVHNIVWAKILSDGILFIFDKIEYNLNKGIGNEFIVRSLLLHGTLISFCYYKLRYTRVQ